MVLVATPYRKRTNLPKIWILAFKQWPKGVWYWKTSKHISVDAVRCRGKVLYDDELIPVFQADATGMPSDFSLVTIDQLSLWPESDEVKVLAMKISLLGYTEK